jgi:hypothetical protein
MIDNESRASLSGYISPYLLNEYAHSKTGCGKELKMDRSLSTPSQKPAKAKFPCLQNREPFANHCHVPLVPIPEGRRRGFVRSIKITSTGAERRAFAAANPSNPPPTTTTRRISQGSVAMCSAEFIRCLGRKRRSCWLYRSNFESRILVGSNFLNGRCGIPLASVHVPITVSHLQSWRRLHFNGSWHRKVNALTANRGKPI